MNGWILIVLRSTGLFFLTLILVRIMGKSHPSKMTPFKFINYSVIAILGALISTNIIGNLPFGLISLAIWCLLPIALDFISMKSKIAYDLINGKEVILIKDGKVMEENLKEVRFTGEDLLRELRTKNAFSYSDVEFAIMEHTGDISIVLKADKKPVTPFDLGWKVSPQTSAQTVILDGNIIYESLCNLGLNEEWLKIQLQNLGVSLSNVFIGQVDSSGDLYVDLFDDVMEVSKPQVKELIYANLEKCHGDLLSFGLETEDEEIKDIYQKDAEELDLIMKKLKPFLLR